VSCRAVLRTAVGSSRGHDADADAFAASVGGGEGLPKGSVEFSILDEGTHIKPHCGPSNHKWRFHLGVIVPDRGTTSIRVGDPSVEAARRPWEEGRVLLFDDSYEHEVFHDGTGQGPRIVLIVDVYDARTLIVLPASCFPLPASRFLLPAACRCLPLLSGWLSGARCGAMLACSLCACYDQVAPADQRRGCARADSQRLRLARSTGLSDAIRLRLTRA
jgi:hypothetical protein